MDFFLRESISINFEVVLLAVGNLTSDGAAFKWPPRFVFNKDANFR